MKFLAEVNDSVQTIIEEGTEGSSKNYYIEGIFAQAEIGNRNGRRYPKNILESQIQLYQNKIADKSALGELNHPQTPHINPERASHLITELRWEGNDVYGKAKILDPEDFACARVARGMIKEGIKFGVSTRGLGSVRKIGGLNEVQKDFRLICVDIVSDPSAPLAFVNGLYEEADWIFNSVSGMWEPKLEEMKNLVKSETKLTLENKRYLFTEFMKIVSK